MLNQILRTSLLALSLLGFINESVAEDACKSLFKTLAGDFPIEEIYPNVKIRNGEIPKASRAFILWRQKTPPQVPDSAFAFHYLPKKTKKTVGRFLEGELFTLSRRPSPSKELNDQSLRQLRSFWDNDPDIYSVKLAPLFKMQKEATGFSRPRDIVKERFSSLESFWKEVDVRPEFTRQDYDRLIRQADFAGAYVVDTSGRTYFFSNDDIRKIESVLKIGPIRHLHLADLVFNFDNDASVRLIDYGNIHPSPPEKKIFESYRKIKWSEQADGSFSTEQYILDYYKTSD